MVTPRDNGRRHGRTVHPAAVLAIASAATGCARAPAAPTFTVFGSFFPAWIVCTLAGIVATLLTRAVFTRIGLDEHLPVKLLVYVAVMLLWSIGLWFVFFGGAVP